MAILLFLVFTLGLRYLDPPIEYGVAVNFGTSDVGSGDVQPTEPIKSSPEEVVEESAPEEVEEVVEEVSTETAADPAPAEKVLTNDNAESIKMKKEEEAK